MVQKSKYPSVKRFGARYGRRVREKLGMIEQLSSIQTKCPFCRSFSVKRIAAGIFSCSKCNSKFTGKAYVVGKKKVSDIKKSSLIHYEAEEPKEEEELPDETVYGVESEEDSEEESLRA